MLGRHFANRLMIVRVVSHRIRIRLVRCRPYIPYSYSINIQKHPTLTMKIYSYRTAALASFAGVVVWMGQRQGHFNREIASLESQLLEQQEEQQPLPPQQSWEELPPVVQRYFHRVFGHQNAAEHDTQTTTSSYPYIHPTETIPAIHSLRFRQTGSFRLDGNWLPFVARQIVATNPDQLGFVWEAALSFNPESWWSIPGSVVKVRVCDALVHGRAYLTARLWGILTLAHKESPVSETYRPGEHKNDDILLHGEFLRWLAEAPLYPTVLLPSEGFVTWQAVEDEPNQAILQMQYPPVSTKSPSSSEGAMRILANIVVTFDPNEFWISQVECMRPRTLPTGEMVAMPWKGYLSHYQPTTGTDTTTADQHTMWVPTHIECGWILDGKEELYFKGNNTDLDYKLRSVVAAAQEQVIAEE
jgi:hypothetical protein